MQCAAVISKALYSEYLGAAFGSLDKAIAIANAKLRYPVLKGIRSEIFLQEQRKGYSFRPGAKDDERIDCLPDGTLRVVTKCSPAL